MREQLRALRDKMQERGIDIYIVPTTDFHGSEYVNEHFKCREYISGFTGSAGTLVVQRNFAGLWTDGRYFIQAAEQLAGSGITLMKMGEEGVPTFAEYIETQPSGSVVGFDGRVVNHKLGECLEKTLAVIYDIDLAGEIWRDRPEIEPSEIYALDLQVTGETTASKLARVRARMRSEAADYLLVTKLEDVAWLYNLRGRDIENTPVFYGYALISDDNDTLYVMDGAYGSRTEVGDGQPGCIKRYDDVIGDLKALRDCRIMLDDDSATVCISRAFDGSVERMFGKSVIEEMRAVKNKTEIAATTKAHVRDGVAMVNALYWLKHNVGREEISEISLAEYIWACRREQGAYEPSFDTIAGYEAHGAIVHYAATEESDIRIRPEGFVLIDSGGQYEDGTTDITRTVALGEVDDERMRNYTAVLRGHIALATAEFTEKETGADLDALSREPLRELGLDFNHGAGHGVGHMLSVHEGPHTISPRGTYCHIAAGTITSDEPGVYIEDRYGIRIENELLCVENNGVRSFEPLTLCPYERAAIDAEMLTEQEISYIDDYHKRVYETLAPMLEEDVREWLAAQCRVL